MGPARDRAKAGRCGRTRAARRVHTGRSENRTARTLFFAAAPGRVVENALAVELTPEAENLTPEREDVNAAAEALGRAEARVREVEDEAFEPPGPQAVTAPEAVKMEAALAAHGIAEPDPALAQHQALALALLDAERERERLKRARRRAVLAEAGGEDEGPEPGAEAELEAATQRREIAALKALSKKQRTENAALRASAVQQKKKLEALGTTNRKLAGQLGKISNAVSPAAKRSRDRLVESVLYWTSAPRGGSSHDARAARSTECSFCLSRRSSLSGRSRQISA